MTPSQSPGPLDITAQDRELLAAEYDKPETAAYIRGGAAPDAGMRAALRAISKQRQQLEAVTAERDELRALRAEDGAFADEATRTMRTMAQDFTRISSLLRRAAEVTEPFTKTTDLVGKLFDDRAPVTCCVAYVGSWDVPLRSFRAATSLHSDILAELEGK